MLKLEFRFLLAAAVLLVSGCGGSPTVSIEVVGRPQPSAVEVHGLPASDLRALSAATLAESDWQAILTVTVGSGRGLPAPDAASRLPMAGRYQVDGSVIRFTPTFGFDTGRAFGVSFDPAKVPGADAAEAWRQQRLTTMVGISGKPGAASTTVRQVYPSGPELPENTLRFYIEFSAPMGRGDALPHIRLVDSEGTEVADPFLPVEAEFWSPDRTRFTLFFDPGRVKRDIKPNRDLGRALMAGRRYALLIDDKWMDGSGAPLRSPHRHEFTATAAIERALDERAWTIGAPASGTRDPLTLTFPWPLDHGLLQRSIRVVGPGGEVAGEVAIAAGERRWSLVPVAVWTRSDYTLEIAPELEDPAGNRVGRAFEVMESVAERRKPVTLTVPVR